MPQALHDDSVHVDVCVVGAGLSGARSARLLLSGGGSVSVVDARDRVGGRLLTAGERGGGGDLGGAWIWPRSERAMERFSSEIGVETVPMRLDGETMVRMSDGRRHALPHGEAARYAACGGGAVRVSGGADGMVRKLLRGDAENADNLSIHLGMEVVSIEHDESGVKVTCKESKGSSGKAMSIRCRAAILAAPPKVIASTVEFKPQLPKVKLDSMRATPTWMEDYGKVSVSFPRNWWRALNMSAISIDQVGAVSAWWEACSGENGDGLRPTLAGFVTAQGAETLRKLESPEVLYDYIIESLTSVYGVDAAAMGMQKDTVVKVDGSADKDGLIVSKKGLVVTYKSWLEDRHTNVPFCGDVDFTTDYGDGELRQSVGRLFFAGTETAPGSGHMEGAVVSAQRAADEVMEYLSTAT